MAISEPNAAHGDEFLELMQAAKDALYDVIMASEPGTGLELHHAYAALKTAIAKQSPKPVSSWLQEQRALEKVWYDASPDRRTNLLFNALGDERLTIREIIDALNVEMRAPDLHRVVHEDTVRPLVTKLWKEGQLDRAPDPRQGGLRYRYFRKAPSGPIVDLERQLDERS